MKQQYKILIIDDEKTVVKALHDHFEREGFVVCVAYDGKEGLDVARAQKPDIILLDITMPLMNGYEMLELAHADDQLSKIPIVILTNVDSKDSVAKTAKAGIYHYLVKVNYGIQELSDKVLKILQSS